MIKQLPPIASRIVPPGSFRVSYAQKKSRTLEFFEELYTYPPKFRVKWETIDELHEDLFMSYNYRVTNPNLPFIGAAENFLHNGKKGESIKGTVYSFDSYLQGYLNKIASTQAYSKQAKQLQESLQHIPVYTILNGQGEIILAASTDTKASTSKHLDQVTYDLCGSFDPFVERADQLGLFFMSKDDAEVYLTEVAKSDTSGTKMLGLSIHCFGLDFAYRVMREYHPNIDFRFIPNLSEIQNLMTSSSTGDTNILFEEGQQQLRIRRRPINVIPLFSSMNKWASPFSSFVEKTEYFKGVPIYVVEVNQTQTNLFVEGYYNAANVMGNVYGRFANVISTGLGLGNSWIIQGSIKEKVLRPCTNTYVFFERSMAKEFSQRYTREISRYEGFRTNFFDFPIIRSKIMVHNLEDFLEFCEDGLAESQKSTSPTKGDNKFDFKTLHMIPPKYSTFDMDEYKAKSMSQKVIQFINFKYRRLSGFVELLLNAN